MKRLTALTASAALVIVSNAWAADALPTAKPEAGILDGAAQASHHRRIRLSMDVQGYIIEKLSGKSLHISRPLTMQALLDPAK
jgi:hypothetical protein